MKTLLLIGFGGGVGSITRYLTTVYLTKALPSPFPYATFIVNVIGCFLIGLIFGCWERFQWTTTEIRLVLSTGFCGGFTTFSTFALENVRLIDNGELWLFALNTVLSVVIGLAAVYLGISFWKI